MAIKWITLGDFWKASLIGISIMLVLWLVLSLFVRRQGDALVWETGDSVVNNKAILIYNPDPFYNFDKQICKTFATTSSNNNWYAEVMTVKAAQENDLYSADLLVFCSNTYNWAPDMVTIDFINTLNLNSKKCAAIILGAGTTDRAQRILEETIKARGAALLGSRAYWLWKPNAEPHVLAPNVHIAKLMAEEYTYEIIENY